MPASIGARLLRRERRLWQMISLNLIGPCVGPAALQPNIVLFSPCWSLRPLFAEVDLDAANRRPRGSLDRLWRALRGDGQVLLWLESHGKSCAFERFLAFLFQHVLRMARGDRMLFSGALFHLRSQHRRGCLRTRITNRKKARR
jgi:hypothetical protein